MGENNSYGRHSMTPLYGYHGETYYPMSDQISVFDLHLGVTDQYLMDTYVIPDKYIGRHRFEAHHNTLEPSVPFARVNSNGNLWRVGYKENNKFAHTVQRREYGLPPLQIDRTELF